MAAGSHGESTAEEGESAAGGEVLQRDLAGNCHQLQEKRRRKRGNSMRLQRDLVVTRVDGGGIPARTRADGEGIRAGSCEENLEVKLKAHRLATAIRLGSWELVSG